MAILYSKSGEKVDVPHAIDVKEWLAEGYTLTKPAAKRKVSSKS